MWQDLKAFLDEQIVELHFSHYGISKLERPLSIDFYNRWIEEQRHGDMNYLATHAKIKQNPQSQWPQLQSAICFAVPYLPHPAPLTDFPLQEARISLYAQGADYHHWIQQKLQKLCAQLKAKYPQDEFLSFTDSSPILERDLAYRAGLGWIGKNTCLIHPKKGSLFFLAEILTTLQTNEVASLSHDFCGHCTRCQDICPTGALDEPRKIDARKCISYLTIETKSAPDVSLRSKINDWFFGCDLCQTVCPWNQKIYKTTLDTQIQKERTGDQRQQLIHEMRFILSSSGKKLEKAFKGTALSRAGSFGLKKNALVVATNLKMTELLPEIKLLCDHDKLKELAEWALRELA